ncbi:hypothetical protein LTR37_018120 [Vermiconidia calcicola]|uniref:Uncharacterized protein n=1 Tax=Vermiconidia calcicola TaxID=1690605 RepID=A0ACC3MI67_9PEZI|nr:hypothetical protein LTR37_018120 [Vermiconidia calcicola]
MKTAAIVSALALASSAFAAPAPNAQLQKQIQTLEIQIVNVVNDIVQSNPNLKTDYNDGTGQYGTLINKLQGPQPCSPFLPGKPTTKKQAIKALQSSQDGLMQLSLDLQNPANVIAQGDLHAEICTAWGYYGAIPSFVGA